MNVEKHRCIAKRALLSSNFKLKTICATVSTDLNVADVPNYS